MMRRLLPALALTATLLGSAQALAAGPAAHAPAPRKLVVSLSPTPNDLSLAEIVFEHPHRGVSLSARSLHAELPRVLGDDYIAVGALRTRLHGRLVALAMLVNRPSALLDPASVHVHVTARRSLGAPHVHVIRNALTDHIPAPAGAFPERRALCKIKPAETAPLEAGAITELAARGTAPAGYTASAEVAYAYDVACGLASPAAFERAVIQPESSECSPTTVAAGSTNCAPVVETPGCTPCDPRPGYACPLAVSAVCRDKLAIEPSLASSAGAH